MLQQEIAGVMVLTQPADETQKEDVLPGAD
jgi:hypothetical protein